MQPISTCGTECQLCGTLVDVEPGFLRVVCQARRGLGSVAANFRCRCCEACAHEARRIKALRFKVVAFMVAWLLLSMSCLPVVGLLLDSTPTQGDASRFTNALILLPALLLMAAGFAVGPLFLRHATRRRTEELLGADINRRLLSQCGIRRWGIFTELQIIFALPTGETSQPLWPESAN